jgi:hypothetical protein
MNVFLLLCWLGVIVVSYRLAIALLAKTDLL